MGTEIALCLQIHGISMEIKNKERQVEKEQEAQIANQVAVFAAKERKMVPFCTEDKKQKVDFCCSQQKKRQEYI